MSDTPLMRLSGVFAVGSTRAVIRDFRKGEKLPLHVHVLESTNHFTVVARGSMRCFGRPGIEGEVIRAGDVLDWVLGEPHGAEALEDDTRIVQILKA